jgi:hypothetical protein
VTLAVPDRLARQLGLSAGQSQTGATDYLGGDENDYDFAGAATVWCVYLPAFYPSTPPSGTRVPTEFTRSALTDRA